MPRCLDRFSREIHGGFVLIEIIEYQLNRIDRLSRGWRVSHGDTDGRREPILAACLVRGGQLLLKAIAALGTEKGQLIAIGIGHVVRAPYRRIGEYPCIGAAQGVQVDLRPSLR